MLAYMIATKIDNANNQDNFLCRPENVNVTSCNLV